MLYGHLFVPLFCPTKISLGRFGPILPWSRKLIAAIKYQYQKIIFNKVPIIIMARTLMSRILLKKLLRNFPNGKVEIFIGCFFIRIGQSGAAPPTHSQKRTLLHNLKFHYRRIIWWIDQSSAFQTIYLICRSFYRYISITSANFKRY